VPIRITHTGNCRAILARGNCARTGQAAAELPSAILFSIPVKVVPISLPSPWTEVMIATAISATISPYSIAVAAALLLTAIAGAPRLGRAG